MATREDVLTALRGVDEPLLGRALTDLDMVRAIEVDGANARVTIAVPSDDYPVGDDLEARVTTAVGNVAGIETVDVGLVPMDDAAQSALRERLVGVHGVAGTSPLMDPNSPTRIVAVASGKGGVGKSSVTVNLAVQLARMGKKTAVIDADVWGFSIPRMLGVQQPPMIIDKLMVPPRSHGVALISMGFFVRDEQPVIWRGPMLHKAIEQFLTDVYWGEIDYLVVDMPPGTGDISLSVAQFLPRAEVLVVTTPQPAAQQVAQRAALMAKKVNLSLVGVVENMSWFTGDDGTRYELFGRGGGRYLADSLEIPLLGQVPLQIELREGGDNGRPISASDPDSEAAQAFAAIAAQVEEMGPKKRRRTALRVTPG